MRTWSLVLALTAMLCRAAVADEAPVAADAAETPEQQAFIAKLRELAWIKGPTAVDVAGNSRLTIPDGYIYLNQADTLKFLELNQNLGDGKEVLVAPRDLHWAAYLSWDEAGYVKDTEKIDADALLKTLKSNIESDNQERKKRGWSELHVNSWAVPPAYNNETKRLEWATTLESDGRSNINFFTKILGRKGYTSVVLVTDAAGLVSAESALDTVLNGYSFNAGSTYAEYKQGDKVAEYGLAALILGGAAAVATKKGLWSVMATAIAAGWKFVVAGVVAASAWLRSKFGGKPNRPDSHG
jgi:uncharacterized membrane-anchored protein